MIDLEKEKLMEDALDVQAELRQPEDRKLSYDLLRSIIRQQASVIRLGTASIDTLEAEISRLEGEIAHKDELLDGRRCECGKGRGED